MIFQIESTSIGAEELQAQVSRFLSVERPRRIRLTQYYHGEQGVRKGPIAQGRPNNQLTANYARYITDVHTGYFLGVAPTLTFDRRRVQERMLRAEKYQRLLMEQARAALEERGIDPRFAAFVLAEDDDRTRKKVEQFDRQLTETVKNHLAAHLSAGEPRDFAVHKPQKRVRGIRKM